MSTPLARPDRYGRRVAAGRILRRGRREQVAVQQPRQGPKTAILLVNGFDQRAADPFNRDEAIAYPWIDVCLRQIERHTPAKSYRIFVWDNSHLDSHRDILEQHPAVRVFRPDPGVALMHGPSLDKLYRRIPDRFDYIVTLDTDSFPVRNGWLANLIGRLDDGAELAGVWREEMAPAVQPYVHPSCFAARRSTLERLGIPFTRGDGKDVCWNITQAVLAEGGHISRMRRSNSRNVHFLLGALYADLVYHQGAGSRQAKFHVATEREHDEEVRVALRDAVFADAGSLMDYLRGDLGDDEATARGLAPIVRLAQSYAAVA